MPASNHSANSIIDHVLGGVSFSQPLQWWVQLHYGDPGFDGTDNVFDGAPRARCLIWSTSSYGWIHNTTDVTWATLPDPGEHDEISHFSVWSGSAAPDPGACLGTGVLRNALGESPVVMEPNGMLIPAEYLYIQWVTE